MNKVHNQDVTSRPLFPTVCLFACLSAFLNYDPPPPTNRIAIGPKLPLVYMKKKVGWFLVSQNRRCRGLPMQLCLPLNLPTTPILFVHSLVSAQKWGSFVLRRKQGTRTLSFDESKIIFCTSGAKWRLVLCTNLWPKPYMTCSVSFAEDVAAPWKF
jgi:hypothetical protein